MSLLVSRHHTVRQALSQPGVSLLRNTLSTSQHTRSKTLQHATTPRQRFHTSQAKHFLGRRPEAEIDRFDRNVAEAQDQQSTPIWEQIQDLQQSTQDDITKQRNLQRLYKDLDFLQVQAGAYSSISALMRKASRIDVYTASTAEAKDAMQQVDDVIESLRKGWSAKMGTLAPTVFAPAEDVAMWQRIARVTTFIGFNVEFGTYILGFKMIRSLGRSMVKRKEKLER